MSARLCILRPPLALAVLNRRGHRRPRWGTSRAGRFDVPHQKFILDNGLTLIVHEDHKAPIVAVNVWYHVGSKNERPGKTGFAHLFEHLMFNGSEHYDDDYFQPLERVGATDMNRHDEQRTARTTFRTFRRRRSIWSCGWSRTGWVT